EANSLMSALTELAASMSAVYSIQCRFHCPKSVLVRDNAAAVHLFRIAQEAAHNAIKHAKPTRVDIGLHGDRKQVTLSVRDDGRGLPKDIRKGRGMGFQI